MRFEIPTCARYFFCIPLRYGILISGYLNLLSSLMVLALEIAVSIKFFSNGYTVTMYKGVSFYCHLWLIIVLYVTEIIFSTILIIGAHTKNMKLLRVFYYYGITTILATLVVFFVGRFDGAQQNAGHSYIMEFSVVFSIFVFQINLLLLIRTELKKLKGENQMTFVNNVSEVVAEGPMQGGRNPL